MPAEWEYRPDGWPVELEGWDAESVAATQLDRWPSFVASLESARPLGQSNESDVAEPDYGVHNTMMSFGYVLGRAARLRSGISMLDWGGGIGQYLVLAHSLFPDLAIEYHSRELPKLVRAGRTVLPDGIFHETDEEALSRTYDLVMASSSLQYSQDWRGLLAGLAGAAAPYLYVTRTPFVRHAQSFVVVQIPHRYGYITEYPGWFLNRGEFLDAARSLGLHLEREFLVDERPAVRGAPEQAMYGGFLFRSSSSSVNA